MPDVHRAQRALALLPLLLIGGCFADRDAGRRELPETVASAPASRCSRLDREAADKATGLAPMGTAGSHVLYGEPGRMLCSEPGTGGRGECELVAPTTVRIVRGETSWGYRADRNAILHYGPVDVTCVSAPPVSGASTRRYIDAEQSCERWRRTLYPGTPELDRVGSSETLGPDGDPVVSVVYRRSEPGHRLELACIVDPGTNRVIGHTCHLDGEPGEERDHTRARAEALGCRAPISEDARRPSLP
jgi:hypothetical protein